MTVVGETNLRVRRQVASRLAIFQIQVSLNPTGCLAFLRGALEKMKLAAFIVTNGDFTEKPVN